MQAEQEGAATKAVHLPRPIIGTLPPLLPRTALYLPLHPPRVSSEGTPPLPPLEQLPIPATLLETETLPLVLLKPPCFQIPHMDLVDL